MKERKYNKEKYFEYDFYIDDSLLTIYDEKKKILILIDKNVDMFHSSVTFTEGESGTKFKLKNTHHNFIYEIQGNSVYIYKEEEIFQP